MIQDQDSRVVGIDQYGQQIINTRWQAWCRHLADTMVQLGLSEPEQSEPGFFADVSSHNDRNTSKLIDLWRAYAIPLRLDEPGLGRLLERALLYVSWTNGYFDQKQQRRKERPAFATIVEQLPQMRVALVDEQPTAALMKTGVCTDARTAELIIQQMTLNDTEAGRRALNHLREYILLPLTKTLGIWAIRERERFRACWQRGWFDHSLKHQSLPHRPALEEILPRCRKVFSMHEFLEHRVQALIDTKLCPDEEAARRVSFHLKTVDMESLDCLEDMLTTGLAYGAICLFMHADYTPTDPLLRLEQLAVHVPRMTDDAPAVCACVRADIVALCSVLNSYDESIRRQEEQKKQQRAALRNERGWKHARKIIKHNASTLAPIPHRQLWRIDLFHRPQYDAERTAYREHLSQNLKDDLVQALAEHRQCDTVEATTIYDTWIDRGLPGLIDWRAAVDDPIRHGVITHRIAASLDQRLAAVTDLYRREIYRLVISFMLTIDELQLPIAVFPLVDEEPGAASRTRFRKVLHADSRIIAVFARHAGLSDDKDASARLHAFTSYGGLGLLRFRKKHSTGEDMTLLERVIDPRLTNYLHFRKLASPAEKLPLSAIMPPVQTYTASLDLPQLSQQVVRALMNRLYKARYWNAGQGAPTAPFRQSSSLNIRKVPRLFEAWVVVPLRLTIPIADERGAYISKHCYVLFVLDHDSVLPLGCWSSLDKPGAPEIGLALYQAIWHVGSVDWPLRGIPRTIKLPASLGLPDPDLADLQQAAFFLGTTIQIEGLTGSWHKHRIVRDLLDQSDRIILQTAQRPYVTCRYVQDTVLAWLSDERFRTLNSDKVPAAWRDKGYAMPAYDSPAAGWLLPLADAQARTERDGLVVGGAVYTSDWFTVEPGQRMAYRMFPYPYPGLERGIFISWHGHLHYLERSERPPLR